MNILDSSAWLEFFVGSKHAENFKAVLDKRDQLVVPTITIFEVFKKFLLEWSEEAAIECATFMKTGKVVELDLELSVLAATLSKEHKLGMADSIILATAEEYGATIWTQDADFKGLPGVKYFAKK